MLKRSVKGPATRERILDAAFQTLWRDGYTRASARTIARRGGFNQALIFYHFGNLQELLLGALDRVSEDRRRRYEEAFDALTTPLELPALAKQLYAEDVDSGHSTVVAELFAASGGNRELREQMLARMQPWLQFAERLIERFASASPLAALVDVRAAAGTVVALYIGMDLLLHLDGDRSRATAMFDAGHRLAATLAPVLGGEWQK